MHETKKSALSRECARSIDSSPTDEGSTDRRYAGASNYCDRGAPFSGVWVRIL